MNGKDVPRLKAMEATLVAVAAAASFAVLVFGRGIVAGSDVVFEAVRLVEYREALADQLLPRLAPDLYFGYGSPIFVFYPPLFLLVTSIASLLLGSLDGAVTLVVVAFGVASALCLHGFLRRLVPVPATALGTIVWILAPYKFTDLYIRNAFAEYVALCLLPVVLYFLQETAASRGRVAPSIGLFVATLLLALAHNITLLVAAPILLATALGFAWHPPRMRTFAATFVPIAAGLAAASFFLLPALVHVDLVRIQLDMTDDRFRTTNNFVSPVGLFFDRSLDQWQSPVLLALLLVAVARFVLDRGQSGARPLGFAALVLSGASLVAMTPVSSSIWSAFSILDFVQFPWRLLVFFTLGTSLAAAYAVAGVARRWPGIAAGLTVAIAVSLVAVHALSFSALQRADCDAFTPERVLFEELPATVRNEYLPRAAHGVGFGRSDRELALAAAAAGGAARDSTRYVRCADFPESTRVRFELLNFPFWKARVDDTPATLVPGQTWVEVDVPAGRHCAEVRLGFTDAQRAGFALSLLSVVSFGIYVWRGRVSST